MKKLYFTIGIVIVAGLGWLFWQKPVPPFAGTTPAPVAQSEPTYFAEIDSNGIVLRVIVISQEMLNTGRWGDPKNWVQTSMDGKIRKNYAGIGYTYNKNLDAFIPPKPNPNWVLDTKTVQWKDPSPNLSPISPIASQ